MEETNYTRATVTEAADNEAGDAVQGLKASTGGVTGQSDKQPTSAVDTTGPGDRDPKEVIEETAMQEPQYRRKTYLDKVKLFQPGVFRQENKLLGMMVRPLMFTSWPVVFFSGFTYGSVLVWFNVLNGTSSLILSGEPYNFKPSMVGLSYLSPLLAIIPRYVSKYAPFSLAFVPARALGSIFHQTLYRRR